ncbi:MAG: phosphatidylglycerophosphatase A [Candidatus Marinimicrobia bacterium]|nr:phosphatidylglycerophosphatase A [Candidatus Neomarinimicrobiota bacterium]
MKTGLLFVNFFPELRLSNSISNWIATVFRIGYLPLAPGTWCSIFAVLIWYYLFIDISILYFSLIILIVSIAGVIASNDVIKSVGKNDPSEVVIDELAGQWLALIALPHTIGFAVASFVLFRIFDIAKPFPIRQLEQYPNGWGVMLDDIAAGLITCGILHLYIYFV